MTKVTVVEGDGIGPEIIRSARAVVDASGADIQWVEAEAGLACYEKTGELLCDKFKPLMEETRLSLKGPTTTPVGTGHRSINVQLRQAYKLYANVRPVVTVDGLSNRYEGVDIITVRENSEDLYKGIEYKISENIAQGVKLISREASTKIGRHALNLARQLGRKKVTIVHKANIMKFTDGLFLESIRDLAPEYPEIEVDDMIIDACCMQLVVNPQKFDMIVTENLYGDIVSDLCAGLIGGLGLAPGANIGDDIAIFEAAHGSAPDIAGKDLANPTAVLMSAAMMLDHINQPEPAQKIRKAIHHCLKSEATRTRDLGGQLGTSQFTKALIETMVG